MTEALIIDLFHGQLLSDSQETWLREAIVKNYATKKTKQVFIMCKQQSPKSTNNSTQNTVINVLEKFGALKEVIETVAEPSMAAAFYRFKREIDELNLSTVKIIAPTPRKAILEAYLDLLFTAVYQFEFEVLPNDPESTHIESPGHCRDGEILAGQQLEQIKREVSTFLGQLPSLRGDITILHSSLIPDMCFLHGFTTRTGGISYTPTLSSLNLFSSSSRRDPKAVVAENIRRLSQKAGFDQESYHRVQVDHGSDVWIMGRREPESYDGIVTNQSGVTLVAPGADCMPLLFADPVQKAIGAAHAGFCLKEEGFFLTIFKTTPCPVNLTASVCALLATLTSFSPTSEIETTLGHRSVSYRLRNRKKNRNISPHQNAGGEQTRSFKHSLPQLLLFIITQSLTGIYAHGHELTLS
ncbi:purine nucleoside phosphorylase LACC1-like isoform X3 [Acipenser ruthenus]|uniref:purine nucleoside phosphorylase LACC1-like isoform X3 n=1 Tax=Acipenser ruthenus TaxID=7906 RepID=UPI002740BC8A|nr:purine nucleoside phosphorylase LACC1-like isoform X3 [Acipenser ruthenus]